MMTDTARWLFRRLPRGLQEQIRRVRSKMPLTAMERWVAREYTPYVERERRELFMGIARFMHVNRPIGGYYFEFGCHEGNTFRMAWDTFRWLFDLEYVAFDSFQGLPEIKDIDRQEIWRKGKLKTTRSEFERLCRRHGIDMARVRIVEGFFEDSLTEALADKLAPKKAAVVYVDCDLYHSTVPVLRFVRRFLQEGSVIVFDDWNCFRADPDRGERRAWREFLERHPELAFESLLSTSMQKVFVCVRCGA